MVGLTVGEGEVGFSDGARVGKPVGDELGVAVVGDCVGDKVGSEAVGALVGEVVGFAVVGPSVGDLVGKNVGEKVGADVVGCCDGGYEPLGSHWWPQQPEQFVIRVTGNPVSQFKQHCRGRSK